MAVKRSFLKQNIQSAKKHSLFVTEIGHKPAIQFRKSLQSRLMSQLRCKSQITDDREQKKDKLYNKHITEFKSIFQSKHSMQALPFIISLRSSQQYKKNHNHNSTTVVQPFDAGSKQTVNQKIKKQISDINSNPKRILGASYRLRNKGGIQTKVSCDFECGLREQKIKNKNGQSAFVSYIIPKRYQRAEERKFKLQQLLCEHQKRSFTLQSSH